MGLLAANGRGTGARAITARRSCNLPARRLNKIRGDEIAMIFQDPMTSLNPYLTIARQMTEVLATHKGIGEARRAAAGSRCSSGSRSPRRARRIGHIRTNSPAACASG